ncbi:MAG: hypothetical protein ACOCV8_00855 [Spirochaetota bacterium]
MKKALLNILNKITSRFKALVNSLLYTNNSNNKHIIPSKGSVKLVNVNKELYRLIDTIKKHSTDNTNKETLKEGLIDHLESLTFIENNFHKIFSNIDRKQILSKVSSILRWNITTIIKIISLLKRDYYEEIDFNSMMRFLYESTWKLILIFEEILGVKTFIFFKRKKRELTYPYPHQSKSNPIDEKQYELELIKMIKEFDR